MVSYVSILSKKNLHLEDPINLSIPYVGSKTMYTPKHVLQKDTNIGTKKHFGGLPFAFWMHPLSPFTPTKILAYLYDNVIQLIYWYDKPKFIIFFEKTSNYLSYDFSKFGRTMIRSCSLSLTHSIVSKAMNTLFKIHLPCSKLVYIPTLSTKVGMIEVY